MSFFNSVSTTNYISVDLNCIEMEVDLTEMDISKPGQIKPKVSARRGILWRYVRIFYE